MIIGNCRPVTDYEKLDRVGEGTYGTVYKARDKLTNQIVALKKLRLKDGQNREGFPVTALREIQILKRLNHPNIVRLLDIAVGSKPDSIFLSFEYCPRDVADIIDNIRRPFSEAEIKCLLLQLLKAVDHMHSKYVMHRDLKMSNLLIDSGGQLKVCDMGLSRYCPHPLQSFTKSVVTLWYRAPEILFNGNYHTAVDMFSVGCIMGEWLLQQPLMPGKTEIQQLELMCDLLGTPTEQEWPGFSKLPFASQFRLRVQPYPQLAIRMKESSACSSEALDLLQQLLTYDPAKRITAKKALEHPYFSAKPRPAPVDSLPTFPPRKRAKNEKSSQDSNT